MNHSLQCFYEFDKVLRLQQVFETLMYNGSQNAKTKRQILA